MSVAEVPFAKRESLRFNRRHRRAMCSQADVGALMMAALNQTCLRHLTILSRINPRYPNPSTIGRISFECGDVKVFPEIYAALAVEFEQTFLYSPNEL